MRTPTCINPGKLALSLSSHNSCRYKKQDVFPLNIAAYFANKCFKGLYSDKEKMHHVYVSEGVNNAVVPMRVCSKRVFPIITIEGEINEE